MLQNLTKLQILVAKLIIDNRFKKAIEKGACIYQIKQYKIHSLTPNQIFDMYNVLTTKFYLNKNAVVGDSWYENELRLFIWLVIGYSYVEQKCIQELSLEDWQYFSEIFNQRKPEQLEFQALSILKKANKFSKWIRQQINLLHSIIKQIWHTCRTKNVKNKWNEIARELYIKSDKKYFRSAKQCRECWINHLDPTPIKSEWRVEEDLELIMSVKQIGKRWAKVSKSLNGRRTEHMVKNRFKSLYHLESKKYKEEFHKILSQDQLINEMETNLQRRVLEISDKGMQLSLVSSQNLVVSIKDEKRVKIYSAEDQITEPVTVSQKIQLQCQYISFEGQIQSQDNQYEKLSMIYQTLGLIYDDDVGQIRIGLQMQKFLLEEGNSFMQENAFS